MNIIDVTLRDGGHAVEFNWPIELARNYYSLMCQIPEVKYIELGYWKQTAKSKNPFYALNMDIVNEITSIKRLNNVSVMIDYHYCSHDLSDYPNRQQAEISMIRLCARKEDLIDALEFGKELSEYSKCKVSFNIFNVSNYSKDELNQVCETVVEYPFHYVYFADTHGSLNLNRDFPDFYPSIEKVRNANKLVGFHLHDHSGRALANYEVLNKHGIDSTDTSVRGIGKGAGNLKLEHVANKNSLVIISEFVKKYNELLTITPTVYELISSKHSITDNYANQARELDISLEKFDGFASTLAGISKDSFDSKLLIDYLNE